MAFQRYKQLVETHATTVIRASVSRRGMGARTLKSLKRYVKVEEDEAAEDEREGGGDENVPSAGERRAALAAQSSKRSQNILDVNRSRALLKASDTSINLAKDVLRSAEPESDEEQDGQTTGIAPRPSRPLRVTISGADSTPTSGTPPRSAMKKSSGGGVGSALAEGLPAAQRSRSTPVSLRFLDVAPDADDDGDDPPGAAEVTDSAGGGEKSESVATGSATDSGVWPSVAQSGGAPGVGDVPGGSETLTDDTCGPEAGAVDTTAA